MTKIEWTDTVWNIVTGCTKIASGCKHCYAARMANRLRGRCGYPSDDPFRVTLHPDRLEQPSRWRKSRMVFVCSMGDLFHDDVPAWFVVEVFGVMAACYGWGRGHTFQVLTKRTSNMLDLLTTKAFRSDVASKAANLTDEQHADNVFDGIYYGDWWPLPNVWLGTSASTQKDLDANVPLLLNTPAAVRFVSLEPLLGSIDLVDMIGPCSATDGTALMEDGRNRGLDWVIVGCESGPHARPMDEDWVRSIRDQCQSAGVKFFYKQRLDGGKKISLPVLDGCTWDQMPEVKR